MATVVARYQPPALRCVDFPTKKKQPQSKWSLGPSGNTNWRRSDKKIRSQPLDVTVLATTSSPQLQQSQKTRKHRQPRRRAQSDNIVASVYQPLGVVAPTPTAPRQPPQSPQPRQSSQPRQPRQPRRRTRSDNMIAASVSRKNENISLCK